MFFRTISESGLSPDQLYDCLGEALGSLGPRRKVLALPPDITRLHSGAGLLTRLARDYCGDRLTHVLPAIGTHVPMSEAQIRRMFCDMPLDLFHPHDWRNDCVTLGHVPADFVREQSEGKLDFTWPVQVNRLLVEGGFDLILSIGQVVPHEVMGMANYNKNVFVGTGGAEAIHKSHYLGAVYGMERMMGRADTPVRRVLNYGSDHFARDLPIVYVLTVVGRDAEGQLVIQGLFVGDDVECFERASELSVRQNITMLEREIRKAVVFLDPEEYRSTWLGNKAVYRTRMAIADGGELVVIAPGVREFGEDPGIDSLIRKYGYIGAPEVLRAVDANDDLAGNLAAAAHLIHGSSEGRFRVTYAPGHVSRDEIEGVNFSYADCDQMLSRYNPATLTDGFHTLNGEEIFYISNPSLGLWVHPDRFAPG